MDYIFEAEISVSITLSDDDFAILEAAAAKHYDSAVNGTIKKYGHLFRAKNSRINFPDDKKVKFHIDELDLTCRSLEFYPSSPAADRLHLRLTNIAKRLIDENRKLNNSFSTQETAL